MIASYLCQEYNVTIKNIYVLQYNERLQIYDSYYLYTFFVSGIYACKSKPCLHKGTCVNGVSQYRCKCVAGYTGLRCEKSKFDTNTDLNYYCFVIMS